MLVCNPSMYVLTVRRAGRLGGRGVADGVCGQSGGSSRSGGSSGGAQGGKPRGGNGGGGGGGKSEVVELTPENFKRLVLDSKEQWVGGWVARGRLWVV
jgi:hypothetical protein